jgi:hypothetical protein
MGLNRYFTGFWPKNGPQRCPLSPPELSRFSLSPRNFGGTAHPGLAGAAATARRERSSGENSSKAAPTTRSSCSDDHVLCSPCSSRCTPLSSRSGADRRQVHRHALVAAVTLAGVLSHILFLPTLVRLATQEGQEEENVGRFRRASACAGWPHAWPLPSSALIIVCR